jgi:very-short-patch-repair endonuclease
VAFDRKIIIEVDGWHHRRSRFKDIKRDQFFIKQGYKVLRFWNSDVLRKTDAVLAEIRNNC